MKKLDRRIGGLAVDRDTYPNDRWAASTAGFPERTRSLDAGATVTHLFKRTVWFGSWDWEVSVIKVITIAVTLAAGCAAPAYAQSRLAGAHAAPATTRQIDPVRRAWLGQAVGHILGGEAGRSDAR